MPLAVVDHLVFAAPDLESGASQIEARLGARPIAGGRHPQWGTRNALLALGEAIYLEVIAPDPDRPLPVPPRLFGLDALPAPRLVTWAARTRTLESAIAEAARLGHDLGAIDAGSRDRADGTTLRWRLSDPFAERCGGVIPFFIDWGDSAHPARSAARGGTLVELRSEHPDPDRIAACYDAFGVPLRVSAARLPAVIATIRTPRGDIELR